MDLLPSIFAAYGIIHLVATKFRNTITSLATLSIVVAAFVVKGPLYSLLPSDNPFILFGAARTHIQNFRPVSMQFNSVDIQDSKNLLLAIAWLNENTEDNSVIVGEKHCRGFMEPYLVDGRTYLFQMTQLPLLLHCRSKAALRTFFLHKKARRPHLVCKIGACKNNGGYLVTVKSNLEYSISFSNLEITIYSFNIQEKGVRVIGFATSV